MIDMVFRTDDGQEITHGGFLLGADKNYSVHNRIVDVQTEHEIWMDLTLEEAEELKEWLDWATRKIKEAGNGE